MSPISFMPCTSGQKSSVSPFRRGNRGRERCVCLLAATKTTNIHVRISLLCTIPVPPPQFWPKPLFSLHCPKTLHLFGVSCPQSTPPPQFVTTLREPGHAPTRHLPSYSSPGAERADDPVPHRSHPQSPVFSPQNVLRTGMVSPLLQDQAGPRREVPEAPGAGSGGMLTIFSLCCCRISSRFCLFL